jgi:hypothetical protein
LFIFYYEIIANNKNILVNSPSPSIINKFFTFVIPFSPYTNNDDNNSKRASILKKKSEFFNGKTWEPIHVQKQ